MQIKTEIFHLLNKQASALYTPLGNINWSHFLEDNFTVHVKRLLNFHIF